ncbi:MAG: peptidoglycan recognition family protein, partial [Myxococcota bacterium]|nr:peptidoglycan recognition family protein [Myxococcota bacterium]
MPKAPQDSIILAGERIKLRGGIKVITYDDSPAWSFEKVSAESPVPLFSKRRHPETKKHVKTMKELAGAVSQVLLHTDLTKDSKMCFDVLKARGLSTHFMVDWDGTIYQGLDPIYVAYHAGNFNGESIGIDINNLMRNLEKEPSATPYNPKAPRYSEMIQPEFKRGGPVRKKINGFYTKTYGYTDPQYQALLELLSVLTSKLDIKPFV